jgi:hypothetical protein|tara:strand:+ start:183 stop:398 length:216 start_codon:yes stop_codon:yes gene_type:complete
MGVMKWHQMKEWEKEDEKAREHKIQMVKNGEADEDIFDLTNNMCQEGCQNYLTVEEDGWGICFDCRMEKDD